MKAQAPLDSDRDGIPDYMESYAGLNPNNPSDAALDKDNDGLSNLREYQLGTWIHTPDYDNDGLLDGYEVTYGFDPKLGGQATLDTDGDGLDNYTEMILKTNPRSADSDGDGISDGVATGYGLEDANGDLMPDLWFDKYLRNDPYFLYYGRMIGTAAWVAMDRDGDGLSGLQEAQLMLNPGSVQTVSGTLDKTAAAVDLDRDGLPDLWEKLRKMNPNDPVDAASDAASDRLTALQEYRANTHPGLNRDRDLDSMGDDWEVYYQLNPRDRLDAAGDPDNDGLLNKAEYASSTDPRQPDSDSDGLRDGFEAQHGFNPRQGGEQTLDGDADGLNNIAEQNAGSNPKLKDSDGDLIPDGWEVAAGLNPNNAADAETVRADGRTNRQAYEDTLPDGGDDTGTIPLPPVITLKGRGANAACLINLQNGKAFLVGLNKWDGSSGYPENGSWQANVESIKGLHMAEGQLGRWREYDWHNLSLNGIRSSRAQGIDVARAGRAQY